MHKQRPTLDELFRAARDEAPVVSFEESAAYISTIARQEQLSFIRALLEQLWAFSKISLYTAASAGAHSAAIFKNYRVWSWSLPHLSVSYHAAVLASGIIGILATFPIMLGEQALPRFLAEEQEQRTHYSNSRIARTQILEYSVPQKRSVAHDAHIQQVRVEHPLWNTFISADSDVSPHSAQTEHTVKNTVARENEGKTTLQAQYDEYGKHSVMRQNAIRDDIKSRYHESTADVYTAISRKQASEEPSNNWSVWQHLSAEARIAARTDLRVLDSPDGGYTATSPYNLVVGLYYALDQHHGIGIEGGTDPFLIAQIQNLNSHSIPSDAEPNTMRAAAVPSSSSASMVQGSSVSSNSSVLRETQDAPVRRVASNRVWAGIVYQYGADEIDMLGGVRPLLRLTIGGGELGAVGRTMLGARFLAREQYSVIVAGEAAVVASSVLGVWNVVPRLGLSLGVGIKF
ncbi:MAG: hypothetical protein RML40_01295 [Bacteroidota bacterium]|nr:hypothetical protein [Candidatus Kapabacteria bacterium]MDW8219143.1 hypothetical protein [Bacteroidota bacterium]